jgi:hypothetical protein
MKKLNKKTIVVGFAALVIAVGAAVNVGVFSKKDKLISGISLANVEALATPEAYEVRVNGVLVATCDAPFQDNICYVDNVRNITYGGVKR